MLLTATILESHIHDILSYWENAVDYDQGGIHFWVDHAELRPFDRKCLLMHARQLYNYAVGIEQGHTRSESIARHLYETLDTVFPPLDGLYPSKVGFGFGMHRRAPNAPPAVKAYDQYYLVIAMARYAVATADPAVFDRARALFDRICEALCPTAGLGSASWIDMGDTSVHGFDGNTNLHCVEAMVNLAYALERIDSIAHREEYRRYLRTRLGDALRLFESTFFDKEHLCTPEVFDDDRQIAQEQLFSPVTMAHPLEWLGFWFEARQLTGIEIPFFGAESRRLTDAIVERAVAPNGCFRNNYYLVEGRCDTLSDFWGQAEAVLGLLYAARIHGIQAYANAADTVAQFYFEQYRDGERGGIYSEVSESGIVIDRQKGKPYKCDHHSLRMCEKILRWNLLELSAAGD